MNFIEKYLAKAAGLETVTAGQEIRCKVDLVAAHDVTGPMAIQQFEQIGIDHVFDPHKVVMVIDHIFPAATVQAKTMHWILKDFAQKYGITLYDKGQGVIHQVLSESHRLQPGQILVGADSHTCTAGGYGVIAIPVGSTELAAAMATGTIDLEVPPVVEVHMTGQIKPYVSGKDIVLTLIKRFGVDGLTDKAVIFTGQGIAGISIEERMTICNMGIEMGAMIACFSEEAKANCVAESVELSLNEIVAVAACPHSPANVRPVAELGDVAVTQVVVGSCTNGRLNDIEKVVNVLKYHKVHPDVNLLIIPASKNIVDSMEEAGWCRILRDAGAVIANPGCGPCFGAHQGLGTERDVIVSTTNRNFPGRMGHRTANIYLTSPATAAETAVRGKITSPGTLSQWGVI
ncbi:aconitase/3-isopropylmalate dehydratase large subunit family protein [Sporomusa sp. KB1]|jgi:3-isopropylmalate/(R)-2-methylmalate dehydratase large subunit|uniref:aconitase/3-isopropylmalate dehydratase large subunit family protein n=1 Tax=Sporomusa sp. KB1 TaxID=943346 RepID=UPI0011A7EABA|nr:aconitase/3-isopropylmalate dehydratase large subunit family protein [Sporomusa sp. KB1]TWH48079.1 3-isopropylmalate/(R)-2-methylmalate dehydratase large subunit [Sporomusa sp. KB1]